MIPHHQNAVNMAKSLLKLWEEKCPSLTSEDTDDCVMEGMLREIVNAQNAQIQIMRELLMNNKWPEFDDCTVKMSSETKDGVNSDYIDAGYVNEISSGGHSGSDKGDDDDVSHRRLLGKSSCQLLCPFLSRTVMADTD